MKATTREIIYVVVLVSVSLAIGQAIWLLPFIIFLPVVITYSIESPVVYLVLLSIYAELFSTAVPGIASLVVWLPYLIKKVWRGGQVDVSFVFIGMIALTVGLQFGGLFLPDVIKAGTGAILPWSRLGPAMMVTTITGWLTAVAVYYNRTW